MVGPGLEPHEPQEGRKFTRRGMWSGPDAWLSAACGIHPRIPPLTHSCTPFPVPALCGTAPETGVQVNKPRLLTVRKATYQV